MKKDKQVSEEQLNAFTDGELDTEEESRIFVNLGRILKNMDMTTLT